MALRSTIKRTIKNLFLVLVFPLFCLYWLLSWGGRSDSTFQSFSQFLSLFPGKTGSYIRAAFYRLACADTSDDISIGFLTVFSHRDTTIHRGVYVGPQCNIGMCEIGEDTLLGSGVHILSGNKQHGFDEPGEKIKDQPGTFFKINIGKDCWIGNGAIITANINNHCIVASGSVLVKYYENEWLIHAGNPAYPIGKREGS